MTLIIDVPVIAGDPGTDNMTGFPVGTRIRAEHGEVTVETLVQGDRLITQNGKLVTVVSVKIETRTATSDEAHPVMIERGSLGRGLPRRDVLVAPDQNIVLSHANLERLFDCTSVMAEARHLTALDGVQVVPDDTPISYARVEFEQSEVVYCSGLPGQSHGSPICYSKVPKLSRDDILRFAKEETLLH